MGWVLALLATLGLQIAAAYILRVIPILAPALAAGTGWGDATAGYLASIGTVGSMVFLLIGSPLTRRLGPVRTSQIGLTISAAGTVLFVWPAVWPAILASFFVGFGYGPSTPAGSDILHRYTPAKHRNFAFSIRQAGVPIGGVIAGVVLPFTLVHGGWNPVLAAVFVPVLAVVLMTQLLRQRIDQARDPSAAIGPRALLALDNLKTPLAVIARTPHLFSLSMVGVWLSIGHGAWVTFLVSYLVIEIKMPLETAGLLFAVMQLTGIAGRMLLGFLADRIGSAVTVLAGNVLASFLTTAVLVAASPSWPMWAFVALAAFAGVSVSSWNGLQIAESSRRAPPGLVAESAAGVTLLIFAGYIAGPISFSIILAMTGRFDVAFAFVAGVTLCALRGLLKLRGSVTQ